MLDQIAQFCLSHFLCSFDPKSRKRRTKDVAREAALKYFSSERVNEFLDLRLEKLQASLVEEFNSRDANNAPLRFRVVDPAGVGEWVQGNHGAKSNAEIKFQNALHSTTAADFERLAAILLRILGCQEVFFTPASHDQGVDAFGYQNLIPRTPYGITHRLTWIAQAKHYLSTNVSTCDVRQLAGSKELLLARVFSTVNERYQELKLRVYAPTAIALITTEEIPSTVRRLAEGAGIYVFASSDLYHLLSPMLKRNTASGVKALILKEGKTISTLY